MNEDLFLAPLASGTRRARLTRRQLLAAAIAGLVFAGCSKALPTYRYRITVEVDTPEGPRSGSSVREVRTSQGPGFPGPEAAGIASQVEGEAVMVDLGPRGVLFALLATRDDLDHAAGIAPGALLPDLVDRSGTAEAWGNNLRALKEVAGAAEVAREHYPLLVRFRDIADPRTVEEADPDDLASTFGPGVRLRRITVEITEDNVTEGIGERLPWLGPHPEPRLDPHYRGSTNPTLVEQLSHGHFRRGN